MKTTLISFITALSLPALAMLNHAPYPMAPPPPLPPTNAPATHTFVRHSMQSSSQMSPPANMWLLEIDVNPVLPISTNKPGLVITSEGANTNWNYTQVKSIALYPCDGQPAIVRVEGTVHLPKPLWGDQSVFIVNAHAGFCDGSHDDVSKTLNARSGTTDFSFVFTASGSNGSDPAHDTLGLTGGIDVYATGGVLHGPSKIYNPPLVPPNPTNPPGTNSGPYDGYVYQDTTDMGTNTVLPIPHGWAQIIYYVDPSTTWNILSTTNLSSAWSVVDTATSGSEGALQVFEAAHDTVRFYRIAQ